MIKNKSLLLLALTAGLTTGINFNHSASAANLTSCLVPSGFAGGFFGNNPGTALGTYLFDQGSDKAIFRTNCDTTDIGVIEGRAGASGLAGDYEVGIGLNGAQADVDDRLQLDWVDETVYNWTLTWNPTENLATFDVGGNSINYDFDDSASPTLNLDKFNAFGIQARADNPSDFISEDTSMTITVDNIVFDPLNGNATVSENPNIVFQAVSNAANPSIVDNFYTINAAAIGNAASEIVSMTGTFVMDIPNSGVNPQDESARSRIGFQVLMFDPPPNGASVPEPGSVLSLLGLGLLGARNWKQKKDRQ